MIRIKLDKSDSNQFGFVFIKAWNLLGKEWGLFGKAWFLKVLIQL